MTSHSKPTILIIIGITGDLSTRKLLPAVREILDAGVLPEKFRIVGVTRKADVDIDTLLRHTKNTESIKKCLTIFQMDVADLREYSRLAHMLEGIEKDFGEECEHLFYLSVPPETSLSIIEHLGLSGLSQLSGTKLLLEKPFGVDLASATNMIEHIEKYFDPENVYRIDHYLAKEVAQNIIVFREENSLFRRTWNNAFIERIEIIASEKIGIEGRVGFYEQTGALRDFVQSHLLQLAALTLMDINGLEGAESDVPARRLAALKSLSIPKGKLTEYVVRGQYEGYRIDVGNPTSTRETYVSLTLASDNPRWAGVPIQIITGKMLEKKTTEVRMYYKKDFESESNELIMKIQPDEGIIIRLWSNTPGYEKKVEKHVLDFKYSDYFGKLPDAYEQVLLDASRSHHDLFTTSDEVLECWRILASVQDAWNASSDDLVIYTAGSSIDVPIKKPAK